MKYPRGKDLRNIRTVISGARKSPAEHSMEVLVAKEGNAEQPLRPWMSIRWEIKPRYLYDMIPAARRVSKTWEGTSRRITQKQIIEAMMITRWHSRTHYLVVRPLVRTFNKCRLTELQPSSPSCNSESSLQLRTS